LVMAIFSHGWSPAQGLHLQGRDRARSALAKGWAARRVVSVSSRIARRMRAHSKGMSSRTGLCTACALGRSPSDGTETYSAGSDAARILRASHRWGSRRARICWPIDRDESQARAGTPLARRPWPVPSSCGRAGPRPASSLSAPERPTPAPARSWRGVGGLGPARLPQHCLRARPRGRRGRRVLPFAPRAPARQRNPAPSPSSRPIRGEGTATLPGRRRPRVFVSAALA
jgi:hypothetical protein